MPKGPGSPHDKRNANLIVLLVTLRATECAEEGNQAKSAHRQLTGKGNSASSENPLFLSKPPSYSTFFTALTIRKYFICFVKVLWQQQSCLVYLCCLHWALGQPLNPIPQSTSVTNFSLVKMCQSQGGNCEDKTRWRLNRHRLRSRLTGIWAILSLPLIHHFKIIVT